jgi:hypothetical protein
MLYVAPAPRPRVNLAAEAKALLVGKFWAGIIVLLELASFDLVV